MTMTGYRDVIDNLGYYRNTVGSLITGLGKEEYFSKVLLADRGGKVNGVRINCVRDQKRGEPELVMVGVPKTHPLFNVEGDDPLDIPSRLNRKWVCKTYGGKAQNKTQEGASEGLLNPLGQLLLLSLSVEKGKWIGMRPPWNSSGIGSILVVDRGGKNINTEEVEAMCKFIQQSVSPLMTDARALTKDGQLEVVDVIKNRPNLEGGL
jgi:hypothetical protein